MWKKTPKAAFLLKIGFQFWLEDGSGIFNPNMHEGGGYRSSSSIFNVRLGENGTL